MSNAFVAHRRMLTVVITALIAGSITGCATAPEPSPHESTSSDIAEIAPSGVHERDVLIRAVQEAASIISGYLAEPTQDVATDCVSGGDGTTFAYNVSVPDDGDTGDALERIASRWAELGIESKMTNGAPATDGHVGADAGPVQYVGISRTEAYGDVPASYEIGGLSHCAPGEPETHYALTEQGTAELRH